MRRITYRNCIIFLLFIMIVLVPAIVMAQGGGTEGCDPLDPTCPIDGGLSALLAIGAGYGIKKIRDARKAVDPE